jgi:hypothetical protein
MCISDKQALLSIPSYLLSILQNQNYVTKVRVGARLRAVWHQDCMEIDPVDIEDVIFNTMLLTIVYILLPDEGIFLSI